MLELDDILTKPLYKKDGILYTEKVDNISYPVDGYDTFFDIEDDSFWFNHRNDCTLSLVRKYAPNKLFLDIGGGNGYVSNYLEKKGVDTVLIEPGQQGAVNASKRGLKNIICSTLEQSGVKKNAVPSIGLFDVIEHIEKDEDFMNMIYSYLDKEGKVFITVPAFNFLWSKEDIDAGHFRRHTLKTLKALMEKTGFKVCYMSYFFSILPAPIFLTRTIPYKIGLSQQKEDNVHKRDHTGFSAFQKLIQNIWRWEANKIKNQKRSPLGSSCIIVASK